MSERARLGPRSAPPSRLPRLLPLIDPDCFDDPAFFRELAAIGYRCVLLGGTGTEQLGRVAERVRRETTLEIVLYPSGPSAVCEADLVIMPDVMNSGAAHARPFGPAAVETAAEIARTGAAFLPVAYFIQSDSTACRYFRASPIEAVPTLIDHCRYAAMVGYRCFAFDYEGPVVADATVARRLKQELPDCWLVVSDEVSPQGARQLLESGVDTVVLPSDILEEASDPLVLATTYQRELLS